MDKIFMHRLKVPVTIGVFEQERDSKQILEIDITLFTDRVLAQQSDNITDTINYAMVRECVIQWCAATSFQLIETLADHLAQKILSQFDTPTVILTLSKKPFDIEDANEVGITIERHSAK